MSAAAPANLPSETATAPEEEVTARASKRYEGLMTVRTKAMKGKGAWYWAHLEPILVHSSETGLPMAAKLRCSLCDSIFSASNPSRTASEHLKTGTCPKFSSSPKPISSIPPCTHHHNNHRKRLLSSSSSALEYFPASFNSPTTPTPDSAGYPSSSSTPPAPPPLVLSGGKDDLEALAMLEDNVKKLRSPNSSSPGAGLSKQQADAAMSLLSGWFIESCGSVSFSAISSPKFRAFLHQVGLPAISPRELAGPLLDSRFEEVRLDTEARLRDAGLFFQLSSHGWKAGDGVVTIAANLPNGTTVYRSSFFTHGRRIPANYAEEVLWNASGGAQRCAGIVSDGLKKTALREFETRNSWMVNLPCQLHVLRSLTMHFAREVPVFNSAAMNCSKLAGFFNSNTVALSVQLVLRTAAATTEIDAVIAMIDDVMSNARALQLAVLEEPFKLLCVEDPAAREVSEKLRDAGFWNELEAVLSFVKLVEGMAMEMEDERPLVGQCLPMWDELRTKVREWCTRYGVEHLLADKVLDEMFRKNYRPAWAAAFVLDPLYLVKDAGGKYLPPFKSLSPEQEKDVDRLVVRLVSSEEAHVALMELMKWRSEGLDPLYAQAVQMKRMDEATGKMKLANPQSSRLVWETCLSELKTLGKVAARLIFLHATSGGFKCNSAMLRWVDGPRRRWSRAAVDRAQKVMFVAANSRLERRDFSNEEEKDAELFAMNDDGALINEAFVDSSSL